MCTRGSNTAKHILVLGILLPSAAAAAAVATTIRDENNSGNSQTEVITASLTKKVPLLLEDKTLLRTSLLEVILTMVCFGIVMYLTLTKLVL